MSRKAEATTPMPTAGQWMLMVGAVVAILAGGYTPLDNISPGALSFGALIFGPNELIQVTRALVAVLVLGAWLVMAAKHRVMLVPDRTLLTPVLLLVVWMAGQGFASPYVLPAWTTWTSWAVALGSFLAIIAVAGRGTGVKWVLGAIVLAIVAMSLRGAMEYGDMRAIDPTWRIFAGYQNPNAAAVIFAAGIPLAVGLSLILPRPLNLLGAILILPLVLALLLTQSRGGLLAAGAGLVIAAGLLFALRQGRAGLAALVPLVLAVLLGFALTNSQSAKPGAAPTGRIGAAQEQSTGVRTNLWRTAIALSREAPMGHGLGSFRYLSGKPMQVAQTHNPHQNLLHLQVEGGVLALGLFLVVGGMAARHGFRGARSQSAERQILHACLFGALAALFANGMVESNWSFFGSLWLFWALAGLWLAVSADGSNPEPVGHPHRFAALAALGLTPIFVSLWTANLEWKRLQAALIINSPMTPTSREDVVALAQQAKIDGELWNLAAQVDRDQALAHARNAVSVLPSTRNMRLLAREQLATLGAEPALQTLERARALDPANLDTLGLILDLQQEAGQDENARQTAETMVEMAKAAPNTLRALPEIVPTEHAKAYLVLAREANDPARQYELYTQALAIYREYAAKTVPYLKSLAGGDEDAVIAGESLRSARTKRDEAVAIEEERADMAKRNQLTIGSGSETSIFGAFELD